MRLELQAKDGIEWKVRNMSVNMSSFSGKLYESEVARLQKLKHQWVCVPQFSHFDYRIVEVDGKEKVVG